MQHPEVYVDPLQAPAPVLGLLVELLGVDSELPYHEQRTWLTEAIFVYRFRGTIRGMKHLIYLYGGTAVFEESFDPPVLRVRLTLSDSVRRELCINALRGAVPVHVRCVIDTVD
jgi:hypothetical protein